MGTLRHQPSRSVQAHRRVAEQRLRRRRIVECPWVQAGERAEPGRVGERVHLVDHRAVPEGVETVDGAGSTLLPGLLDAHVHTWGEARSDSARFGVTTLLDHFTAPAELGAAREDRRAGGATDKADLFSAGFLATVDGGHGTQFGLPVPTLDGPEGAAEWVKARKAEGSDWIKIVVERGWRHHTLPTLELETVRALIEAAHAEGLKAVVHATQADDALAVAEMGADGLVHVWSDRVPSEAETKRMAESGLFVIPTLVVLEGMDDASPSRKMAESKGLGDRLTSGQRQSLDRAFPYRDFDFSIPFASVRALIEAGVPVLAGSDAPNPTTAMGFSLHRELELLVEAGLEPEQALRATTSASADAFGVPERGRIRAGSLADLVLVAGDPTREIVHTRGTRRVWKAGREIELAAPPSADDAGDPEAGAVAPTPEETMLADFELGLGSRFGSGWVPTTDQMRGGSSETSLEVKEGVLVVTGEVKEGFAFPWAGAMVFVGKTRMGPVDLSPKKELRFRVRGDGRTYLTMFFSGDSPMPSRQLFETGEEWQEVVLPLDSFAGGDPARAKAFAFTAGSPPGPFRLELDEVEIR